MTQPHFANARSIRNALDRARLRQAVRLFEQRGRPLTPDDLVTIEPEEILRQPRPPRRAGGRRPGPRWDAGAAA